MSVTKLSIKDFKIENCCTCERKFTRAMMIDIKGKFFCIRCLNGGKKNQPPSNINN